MERNYRIAVSITTHNRYEVFKNSYTEIKRFLPKSAKLVVIDDGSDIPVKEADFRFEKAQGIAAAKNKAFELMGDADYYFCFDDDVYTKVKDWHLPYIESGMNHLCFTFGSHSDGTPNGRRKIATFTPMGRKVKLNHWHSPCGLMLFFTRKCLDLVGGMDEEYGVWGHEHLGLSMRIHNAKLTPFPFMDVENSMDLFRSLDYEKSVDRSVSSLVRADHIRRNQMKYSREIKSSSFIPFKKQTGIILTSYFTGVTDPQRGQKWDADVNQLKPLIESAKANNCEVLVLHDCFKPDQEKELKSSYNNVELLDMYGGNNNPYFQRWQSYRNYLYCNHHENVFFVDCNDVEVLKNPFQIIRPSILYCGWEKDVIGCQWMQKHHKSNFMQNFIKSNMKTPLLNAGVIGGRYEIVMEFLDRLCDMYEILPDKEYDVTDMPMVNWIIYSHFLNRFETGIKITTEFKSFKANQISLFKHK